ncbi:MAG TPA: GNAT family N-acetyltransferase [Actinomycetes bacterium]|nr:GNAT family N-acetyltransferase [Actinomycetes bacterium]
MSRPAVVVRDAQEDDLPALLQMWSELRDLAGRMERLMPAADDEAMRKLLVDVDNDPYSRALVAVVDDEVAGIVLLSDTPYAPLFDQRAVNAHYLHVREGFRRRGVGKALLAAAVAFAEETGAEHVMTSVLPQLRETQRFYARLGMSPVVVRRSAPVSMLRRRLSASGGASVTDSLLARRRTLRRVRAAVARVTD